MKYSLLLCPVVGIVGGVFFVVTAVYIAEDRKAVQQLLGGNKTQKTQTPKTKC